MSRKIYLDANVLIAHQVTNHIHHDRAKTAIDDAWKQSATLLISSLTFDECFYGIVFLLRHMDAKKMGRFSSFSDTLKNVHAAIMSWDNVSLVEFHHTKEDVQEVLELMQRYNLRPRDAFHIQIMKQQQANTIITFDQDFDSVAKTGRFSVIR